MEKPSYPLIRMLLNYLKKENYHVNPHDFKLQILSNPSYPSIRSITDTLDYFNIKNVAAILPIESLSELPDYFLTHITNENSNSIVEVHRKNSGVKLYKDDGTKERISTDQFKEIWNGAVVLVEPNLKPRSITGHLKKPDFWILASLIAVLFMSISSLMLNTLIITAIFIVGLILGYFLVREDLGIYNRSTSKICNSTTINTSCSDVINSSSSKIFGTISLSDATITYFISGLLILATMGYNASFFFMLSLISLPVVMYSLYAQAYVIKKWCPLCLGVSLVLLIQIGATYYFLDSGMSVDSTYLMKAIPLFIMTLFLWVFIKSLLEKEVVLEETKSSFYEFKWDYDLFQNYLEEREIEKDPVLNGNSALVFGNPNAPLVITGVTNPMCGFCSDTFLVYDKLIQSHEDKICLNLVFNLPLSDLERDGVQIAQRIMELHHENVGKSYIALKEWYSERRIKKWRKKYGETKVEDNYHALQEQNNWCMINNIAHTPTTIINSNIFPKKYDIDDLPLFIDFLIDWGLEKKEPVVKQAQ